MNANLWNHKFGDQRSVESVVYTIKNMGIFRHIWKITSLAIDHRFGQHIDTNKVICHYTLFQKYCTNISRCTAKIWTEFYVDNFHFVENIYRLTNKDLLNMLGFIYWRYVKHDRHLCMMNNIKLQTDLILSTHISVSKFANLTLRVHWSLRVSTNCAMLVTDSDSTYA